MSQNSLISQNKKARHDYEVLDSLEAGIALTGTEVKSCREHNVSLRESHARILDGELWLIDAHIAPYKQGNISNHEPRRKRKLLVHKSQLRRLAQATEAKGLTLVPLKMYFSRNRAKIELGLCRGKRKYEKRESMKRKLHKREAEQGTG